jgi:CheY-like chemotaxis protein
MRNALKKEGYELLEAANGQDGLEMAFANSPDCIVLDLVMPEVSGMDVLQTLADQDLSIPVVVHNSDI